MRSCRDFRNGPRRHPLLARAAAGAAGLPSSKALPTERLGPRPCTQLRLLLAAGRGCLLPAAVMSVAL
jgi:hypothetical protein